MITIKSSSLNEMELEDLRESLLCVTVSFSKWLDKDQPNEELFKSFLNETNRTDLLLVKLNKELQIQNEMKMELLNNYVLVHECIIDCNSNNIIEDKIIMFQPIHSWIINDGFIFSNYTNNRIYLYDQKLEPQIWLENYSPIRCTRVLEPSDYFIRGGFPGIKPAVNFIGFKNLPEEVKENEYLIVSLEVLTKAQEELANIQQKQQEKTLTRQEQKQMQIFSRMIGYDPDVRMKKNVPYRRWDGVKRNDSVTIEGAFIYPN